MPPTDEIEIFRAGTHTSSNGARVTLSEEDLDAIASSYNPEVFEAPAVVGHPRDNSPAYGWVESLRRVGEKLLAKPRQIDPDFEEAVKAGRYKKISASFYSPQSSANPKPGTYYLRHVGFLGGMAPAVKGLASVAFSEIEEGVVDFCDYGGEEILWRNLREWLIDEHDIETADRIIPAWVLVDRKNDMTSLLEQRVSFLESKMSELFNPDMEDKLAAIGEKVISLINGGFEPTYTENAMSEDFTEHEQRLKDLEEKLATQETVLQARETALKRGRIIDFVESRVKEGRLLPADKVELVEFMCSLPEGSIDFAEDKSETSLTWFERFLTNRPKVVEFREVATDKKSAVNIDAKAIADKATELVTDKKAKGLNISFSEAVQIVMEGAL